MIFLRFTEDAILEDSDGRESLGMVGDIIENLRIRPRGRPKASSPKEQINIRLSPEVLAYFRESGAGWQTRIDLALKQFVERNKRA